MVEAAGAVFGWEPAASSPTAPGSAGGRLMATPIRRQIVPEAYAVLRVLVQHYGADFVVRVVREIECHEPSPPPEAERQQS